jgi:hypothetical protein
MKLEIILRTHDRSNVHDHGPRYCGFDKTTLITGCLKSLVNSANQVKNHQIYFKILDDHSSEEFVSSIDTIFQESNWDYELHRLSRPGFNFSALKQFEFAKNSNADLIYSIEDDYLHCPSAINEMLDSYEIFTSKTGSEIVIFPFDLPDDYGPKWMERSFVVHGSNRHWRTGTWTTNTFMLRPEVIKKHWPLFEKLALEYNPDYSDPNVVHVDEGNTICEIWRNHAIKFSPIPSLALHMQFDTQKDPFIDWQKWWREYTTCNKD